jgi:hypothetical protein
MRISGFLAVFLSVFGACGGDNLEALRSRSAFDLKCSESSIHIRNLDEEAKTFGVTGCGQRAVYVWDCNQNDDCKFVLNSPITDE